MIKTFDELLIEAGLENVESVYCDNPEVIEFGNLVIKECIKIIQYDIVRNGNTPENNRTTKHVLKICGHFGIKLEGF